MLKSFRKFIPFAKVEEQKDGTLFVYGLVTAEKPDQESEVCDYDSTKPFYQKLVTRYAKATAAVDGMDQSIAPLREMHQLKAVGCGKSIDFNDDAKTIHMGFHVVESEACKKVRAGVLIGFSQGGDYIKTWKKGPNTWYTADPGEVSLVDSPCLEDALIQQLVEKSFTYVQENGSTELRKFQVKPKKADPVPARDGSLTRTEKLDGVRKAHALVADAMKKSMYDVKSMVDVMQQLRSTCSWLYDEKEFEGDESEVPEKLKGILTQLATVFLELVQEETAELIATTKVAKGATTMDPKELAKKLAELEKGSVSFTKAELDAAIADGVLKAGKSLHEHLQNLHKMHTDHNDAMTKCIEKCKKAVGGEADGEDKADKAENVTMTKAELDAKIAKALEDAKKPATPEVFTKAEAEKLVNDAVEKAKKEMAPPANDPTSKVKLQLIGRDGKPIEKAATDTPQNDESLAKSVGF
jgi:hypothetical protein